MDKVTLYNKSSKGKIKLWSIWTEDGVVCREWGMQGGKLQRTEDAVVQKNVGRANETSYEEQAQFEAERLIRLKREEGYTESINSLETLPTINWTDAILPDSFAPSKPETSVDPADEAALVKSSNAIYQRKHNGMRAFVIKGDGAVNIYSRRMELKTENFPKHVALFKNVLPIRTIIDCEVIATPSNGYEDPDLIKTIFGADAEKAIERQLQQTVDFVIFDVLYYDGDDISSLAYEQRYKALQRLKPALLLEIINRVRQHISMVDIVENIAKPKKIPADWEGLILRDKTAPMKIRWDGKPDRKSGSWKIKNFKECDLVCHAWTTGKGRLNDNVATLQLGAYNKAGMLVHVCESGSGLDEESRAEIRKISPNGKTKFVVEIKYEEKTPSGSLRLPIFLRTRPDKKIEECLFEDIK